MIKHFMALIKTLKMKQHEFTLLVRALLKRDKSQQNKNDKGVRLLNWEQIPSTADMFKANCNEILTLWLASQIYMRVKNNQLANELMHVGLKK